MRPQRAALELGPGLYEAHRPTASAAKTLRPVRPHLRGPAAAGTAAKPSNGSADAIAVANAWRPTAAATPPPPLPPRGFALPYAPSAGAPSSRPSPPSLLSPVHLPHRAALRASPLEALLQYAMAVDEQCLDEADAASASRALELLRQRRRQRKGVKPTPPVVAAVPTPGTAVANGGRPRRPSDLAAAPTDSVAAALVAAGEAATARGSVDILEAAAAAATPAPSCLLTCAAIELRCQAPGGRLTAADLAALDAAAGQGHPAALLRVGLCLRDGAEGVAADLVAALPYIEQAAAVGYAPAMHELAELYEAGHRSPTAVLEPDWGEAVRWYRRAAAAGHVPSRLNLGKLLLVAAEDSGAAGAVEAADIVQLRQRSREWLEQAAADGSEEAARLLLRI